MALNWSNCPAVESVPGKVSGAWVFRGTRIPVAAVFENLEDGLTIDEVAEHLEVGHATVERAWGLAKAWLFREMSSGRP